ncbi:MAG: hypothetical protein ACXVJD_04005 [Mucilaginibacter sp.]
MEHLPLMIPAAFFLTALLTLWLLYRAARSQRALLILVAIWLVLQAALSLSGFYQHTSGLPPRFALLIFPPVVLILITVFRNSTFDMKKLALVHVVRVPVELVLYGLYLHHAVPRLMTFEGGNLDILSGLSAPFIYYFGFVKPRIPRGWLIAWNMVCLALLFNIVGRAILSGPFDFQRLGFEQPNVALLYFPFSWLPAFVVPAVLFAHLSTLRQFFKNK